LGAKLIVVDPRRIGLAVKADCWLPVRPGTDAAVALAAASVMLEQGWFDEQFVREWTNGPHLVREDNGTLLRAEALASGIGAGFVAWDRRCGAPRRYDPIARAYDGATEHLALYGHFTVAGRDGPIVCRPAFDLFAMQCCTMSPERAAALSGVEAGTIREMARLLWQHRPIAHYTWTGLEQQSNATQTDRAIAILHALTGSIDAPGGNLQLAQVPVNDVSGNELREPRQSQKALGLVERPLGPARSGWITSDNLYRAVLEAEPYRVRGLVGFGTNLLLSHADAARGAEALRALEFYVQTDLYLTPTAAYADIVLPVASAWEREGLRVGFGVDQDACELVQLRPAIVAPRGEARPDMDIIFDLAVRLGLGNQFWDGNIDAALAHHLAPSGLTLDMLRAAARGIRVPLETRFYKYRQNGFATASGKVEVFSEVLQQIGEAPLPEFRPPFSDPRFPLTLTSAKTPLYCHSQHRNLPRLRRLAPDPVAEMSPGTASAHGVSEGDWIVVATPRGRVRARAHFNATLSDGIVAAQHGWWQACPELGLPGYSALDDTGANVNLIVGVEGVDPVSGAAPHRCYPCEIEKSAAF
jgi:anaerobic selenocysteine-containing dehydrogenase